MSYALFWAITQRRVVIPYRRFGITYSSGPVGCPETSVNNYNYTLRNFLRPRVVLRFTAIGDVMLGAERSGLAFLAIWDNDGACSASGKYVYIQLMISDTRQVFPKPTTSLLSTQTTATKSTVQRKQTVCTPRDVASGCGRAQNLRCGCGLGSAHCVAKIEILICAFSTWGGARVHAVSKAG